MDPRNRLATLLTADVAHLLHETPDRQHDLGQLILDMEGSIVALRREAVAGVVRRKRLEQQLHRASPGVASRRAIEVELAREGRQVLALLRAQIEIEDRALALRREQDAIARCQRAAKAH